MRALLWVLQRASGLLLVVVAGSHIAVQQGFLPFAIPRPTLIAIDGALLALVLYHGLNGLRTVVFDYITQRGSQRVIDWALWAAGLALFAYGGWGLVLLMR